MGEFDLAIDLMSGDYGYAISKIMADETVRETRQIFFCDQFEAKELKPLIDKYGYTLINELIMKMIDREKRNERRTD